MRKRLMIERRVGHVWGMDEGTARDNSGIERSVVIWLRPARTLRSSSIREGVPCMACKPSAPAPSSTAGSVRGFRQGVLGFANLDMSRQAIQALICEEGEPCGVLCCCW
jgi:hypothetical protein